MQQQLKLIWLIMLSALMINLNNILFNIPVIVCTLKHQLVLIYIQSYVTLFWPIMQTHEIVLTNTHTHIQKNVFGLNNDATVIMPQAMMSDISQNFSLNKCISTQCLT